MNFIKMIEGCYMGYVGVLRLENEVIVIDRNRNGGSDDDSFEYFLQTFRNGLEVYKPKAEHIKSNNWTLEECGVYSSYKISDLPFAKTIVYK